MPIQDLMDPQLLALMLKDPAAAARILAQKGITINEQDSQQLQQIGQGQGNPLDAKHPDVARAEPEPQRPLFPQNVELYGTGLKSGPTQAAGLAEAGGVSPVPAASNQAPFVPPEANANSAYTPAGVAGEFGIQRPHFTDTLPGAAAPPAFPRYIPPQRQGSGVPPVQQAGPIQQGTPPGAGQAPPGAPPQANALGMIMQLLQGQGQAGGQSPVQQPPLPPQPQPIAQGYPQPEAIQAPPQAPPVQQPLASPGQLPPGISADRQPISMAAQGGAPPGQSLGEILASLQAPTTSPPPATPGAPRPGNYQAPTTLLDILSLLGGQQGAVGALGGGLGGINV